MYLVLCADRRFQNTGIERAAALEQDIRWFQDTYNLEPPAVTEDGPGEEYSRRVFCSVFFLGWLLTAPLAHTTYLSTCTPVHMAFCILLCTATRFISKDGAVMPDCRH